MVHSHILGTLDVVLHKVLGTLSIDDGNGNGDGETEERLRRGRGCVAKLCQESS